MAKSKEQLMKKSKDRRKRLLDNNLKLKSKKNWFPVSNVKRHFARKIKLPRAVPAQKDIQPGQIMISYQGGLEEEELFI